MSGTPRRRKHKPQSSSSAPALVEPPQNLLPSKEDLPRLIAVLAIAASIAFSCNFLVTYFNSCTSTPFCDTDPISQDSLSDYCEPCPSNGICQQDKLECLHGFRKHGKMCVEDGDVNDQAKRISNWVETLVCESYAHLLCYGTGTMWVQEDSIWNDLDGQDMIGNFGLENELYLYSKKKAVDTIENVFETRNSSDGMKELKCPDSLVEFYKPLQCRIRQWVLKNILVVAPICFMLLGFTILLHMTRQRQKISARVEELYCQVCDILEENALTSKISHGECEPWIVASQLRDHLLFPKERKHPLLWKKVEELVQEDSRVDRYPKLVKGESKVVWEWQVEGSLSSFSSRKSTEGSKSKSKGILNLNLYQPDQRPKAGEQPRLLSSHFLDNLSEPIQTSSPQKMHSNSPRV